MSADPMTDQPRCRYCGVRTWGSYCSAESCRKKAEKDGILGRRDAEDLRIARKGQCMGKRLNEIAARLGLPTDGCAGGVAYPAPHVHGERIKIGFWCDMEQAERVLTFLRDTGIATAEERR